MSFSKEVAVKAPWFKRLEGALFGGPTADIAQDNGFQNYVFDPAGNVIPFLSPAGSSRGKTILNNPNGSSFRGTALNPAAPTVTPTGGSASTWTYLIVARASNATSAGSATGTTAAGAATLTQSAYNTITWAAVAGAISYDIYRTVAATAPTTTGKIGNVLATSTLSFTDTGVAGDGTTAPTVNTMGAVDIPLSYDINVIGLATPQGVTVTPFGTVGVSSVSYIVSAVTDAGTQNPAAAITTTTANASLTAANGNTVAWKAVPGAASYNIFRSAGGASQGLIGNVTATSSLSLSFSDTGIVATTATVTVNNTGQILYGGSTLSPSQTFTALTTNGAIPPHVPATYVITKAGVLADTLAAPTATTDDGIEIYIVSNTTNAHTLTATGLLGTGTASVNLATFAAFLGAGLLLKAYQGKWLVKHSVGITFS